MTESKPKYYLIHLLTAAIIGTLIGYLAGVTALEVVPGYSESPCCVLCEDAMPWPESMLGQGFPSD